MENFKMPLMLNACLLLLFSFSIQPLHAQTKKINEKCATAIECDADYCVEVTDPGTGRKKKVCADCSQSSLDRYSSKVNQYCKGFGSGWTTASSPEYKDATAQDGRVRAGVFDEMLQKAKNCKSARNDRERACFAGGDATHAATIRAIENSIRNISSTKSRAISDRRVYHSDRRTYDGKLNTFNSKCGSLNFSSIDSALDAMERDIKAKKKVDCDELEEYRDDCQRCVEAAEDLKRTGFQNSSSKFPGEYAEVLSDADDNYVRAKILLDDAEDDDLCD